MQRVALTSRSSRSIAPGKLCLGGARDGACARGRRPLRTKTNTKCYTYRGGEDSDGRDRRGRRDEGVSPHATPPLKANRAFLSDPFCTVAEDSEAGLCGHLSNVATLVNQPSSPDPRLFCFCFFWARSYVPLLVNNTTRDGVDGEESNTFQPPWRDPRVHSLGVMGNIN